MIIKSIITTLFTFASVVALAQDKSGSKLKPDSIIKEIPTQVIDHKAYGYSINGKMQTSEDVKVRLYAYAPSKTELLKSTQQTTYLGLSIIGVGLSGAGATLEYIDNEGGGPHHNLTGAYVLTGAATALIISAIYHGINASHHSHKALALYNGRYQ